MGCNFDSSVCLCVSVRLCLMETHISLSYSLIMSKVISNNLETDDLLVRVFANINSFRCASCFRSACQIYRVPKETISWHSISNNTCHDFSGVNANRDFLCVKLPHEKTKKKTRKQKRTNRRRQRLEQKARINMEIETSNSKQIYKK